MVYGLPHPSPKGVTLTDAKPHQAVCLVVGAGDATGGAIARRFAREGFTTCVTRRSAEKLSPLVAQIDAAGGKAHAFGSDARKEEEVIALVEQIESGIGATASMRGSANFSAFAGAKHALRALAQSMARELAPRGIHVAHTIIDGAIDTAFIRDLFPERYALKAQDGILNPDHIADAYWMLHTQPRDAWTHELDLRPYMEKF